MDDEVKALVRGERLLEAAALALSRGEPRDASELFERACAFGPAARAALDGGDLRRALVLAATADDDATAEAALAGLRAGGGSPEEVAATAGALERRGRAGWAARAYEAAGQCEEAAACWERAGDLARAATLLEGAADGSGQARAARVLEAGLRADEARDDLRVALGALLLRAGRAEAAVRTLQRVGDGAPEKPEARRLARRALLLLGMHDAAAQLASDLGGAVEPASRRGATAGGPAAPPPPRLFGRYEVVREVSSTATARVLECVDVVREERVAVKLFAAGAASGAGRDALSRFVREARILGQLAHPHVVPLRELIEQGPAMVLAWMAGGTLEDALAGGRFSPARAAATARGLLAALAEAHRLGIVHRDVKPANVLFDASGTARLADFGVAHLGDVSVTATAGSFGTLAYMSPEQREGRPATARSDLFSVGVVLVEMLTGERPSAHPSRARPLSAFHRHLDARHDALVDSLLARAPTGRPADAFAAARAIEALPWPGEREPEANGETARRAPSERPPESRTEDLYPVDTPDGARLVHDRWLARRVVVVPLGPQTLDHARRFDRARGPSLQTVLRVDLGAGALWLTAPRGQPLRRPLRPDEHDLLARALARLHAARFVYGGLGAASIVVADDGPTLLFATPSTDGAPGPDAEARDRAALRALC